MGLVVGATYPAEVARVRELAPTLPLLIPGVGAQGGDAASTVRAGWRITEQDVSYLPRAAGTRSKVSGSVRGTLRTAHDFWAVLR